MELTSKGICWADDIYKRLEAVCVDMCQELDAFAQEHGKSIETHVQIVGTNVQKFCAEVRRDFFSPSSVDSVEEPSSDLSPRYRSDATVCGETIRSSEKCSQHEELCARSNIEVISSVTDNGPSPDEHAKSIETPVQIVGTNVQNFCAKVGRDLFSPSSVDSVEGLSSDLSPRYDSDASVHGETTRSSEKCFQLEEFCPHPDIEVISSVTDNRPSQDVIGGRACDLLEEKSVHSLADVADSICPEKAKDSFHANDGGETPFNDDLATTLSYNLQLASLASHQNGSLPSIRPTSTYTMTVHTPTVDSISDISESHDGESIPSGSFISNDSLDILDSYHHFRDDKNICNHYEERMEDFEDVVLAESYNDEQKQELHNEMHKATKKKSYKKKIKDAILSKLQLAKKDYNHVADICGNTEYNGTQPTSVASLLNQLDLRKISSQDLSESEWELL